MSVFKEYAGTWTDPSVRNMGEQYEREQYDFTVEMKPVMFESTVQAPALYEYKHRKVIVRKDIGRPLAVVSNAYRPVLHQDVLRVLDDEFRNTHLVFDRKVRVFDYGAKMAVTYRFPEHKVVIGDGDSVCMTLDVLNSFNTQTSVFMDLGGFRWKCSNGMRVGMTIALLKAIHKGEMHAKVESMGVNLAAATTKFAEHGALWREYARTPFSLEGFDRVVQDLQDQNVAVPRKRALGMIRSRFASSEPSSVWGMYNAITNVASFRVKGFQSANALLRFANVASAHVYGSRNVFGEVRA